LTVADVTPGIDRSAFSTRATQEAHVMPSMASETDGVWKEAELGWFMSKDIATPPVLSN
jgi:hypothetical protein